MIYNEQSACFDPATAFQEGLVQSENDFSKPHMDDQQSYSQGLDLDLQNQEMQSMIDHHNNMVQEMVQNPSWQEMNNTFSNGGSSNGQEHVQNGHFGEALYPTTPDLLNMFPLPRCSASAFLPNSNSINFSSSSQVHKASSSFLASLGLFGGEPGEGGASGSNNGVLYDSMLPVNLQPQPPMLKELFHSLPYANGSHGSLFGGGVDYEREGNVGSGGLMYQDGDGRGLDNGVFMFTSGEMNCLGKNREGKDVKHFATERNRRVQLNDKFQTLRKLIPQPTKSDRASIVGDAIEYINELKRTVNELKRIKESKRCARERLKRPKAEEEEEDMIEQNGSNSPGDTENPFNGPSLRSSWLRRKSKNTEVDVRIIDDEVNVKLVQQKRVNCLLFVSRVLDELQLDLHHVAGGLIGDYYSFLFNSKIGEGSIVYASAIADKLIEVVDKQYAAIPPTNSY